MAPPFTGLGKRLADEGGVWQHSPMPGFTTEMLDTPRGLPVRPKDGTAHCLRLAYAYALAAVAATRPATQDGTVVPPRAPSSYEDVRDRRPSAVVSREGRQQPPPRPQSLPSFGGPDSPGKER